MINYLWAFMIAAAFVIALINGKLPELSQAALSSVKDAALMCINLIGAYALWLGVLNIARKSGLTEKIAKLLSGAIRFVFHGIEKGSSVISSIALNIAANMLGMGNAATPFGLRAMQELQELNTDKKRASDAMCMLLVVNSTSIQLMPMTVIALRSAAGAANPADIVFTTLIATVVASITGITAAKIFEKRNKQT